MAVDSNIAWTDATFNPWRGCLKVAAECEHCYALTLSQRFGWKHGQWGSEAQGGTRVLTSDAEWRKIRKLNEESAIALDSGAASRRQRVFVASLADVFEDWQGPIVNSAGRQYGIDYDDVSIASIQVGPDDFGDAWIGQNGWKALTMSHCRQKLFNLIDECKDLDFLLLTKRPENIPQMLPVHERWEGGKVGKGESQFWPNVWLGTSAGTQATAEKALPELIKCRSMAPVLFVSAEPLLEAVDFSQWLFDACSCAEHAMPDPGTGCIEFCSSCEGTGISSEPSFDIDWIIAGAESGADRRPFDPEWVSYLADQAKWGQAAFFCKQGSAMQPGQQGNIPDELFGIKQFPEVQNV